MSHDRCDRAFSIACKWQDDIVHMMNAVSVDEMIGLEREWFSQGRTAADLMEQAGWGIACAMAKFFPDPGLVRLYLGKGHNAGDALCAARHLRAWGWRVELEAAFPEVEWAVLTRQQWRALQETPEAPRRPVETTVIVDALLGIGARGALREPIRSAVSHINDQRMLNATPVVALDIPTGLNADTGESDDLAVVADYTFFIGAPKRGLLSSASVNHVGRLEPIALGEIPPTCGNASLQLVTPSTFPRSLAPRPHDFHKGNAGRVAIMAGSPGMEGAALLCATAAMRAGAGLVTLWVKESAHTTTVARACPALMVRPFGDWREISLGNAHAFAIGPGLGDMQETEFQSMAELIAATPVPGVFDADALNAIARHQGHHCLRESHVITPHPGEFSRLAPLSAMRPREEACSHFTQYHPSVLLLKGARTLVQQRGAPLYHNSTGHAGMATAGMGDVLTGVIAGLQAQGIPSIVAACAGAWLCGRAAEISIMRKCSSIHSLTAPDLLESLGSAMREWQSA